MKVGETKKTESKNEEGSERCSAKQSIGGGRGETQAEQTHIQGFRIRTARRN